MTPDPIFQILSGYRISGALKAAIELGVFDALGAKSATAAAIARRCGSDARGMRILLDALIVTGLVRKSKDLYRSGPRARRFLLRGRPEYVGSTVRLYCHPSFWSSYADVASAVRAGRTVRPSHAHTPRQPFWEDFARLTADTARQHAKALVRHLGITSRSGPLRVLDVACGSGMYGLGIAEANPRALVTLHDQANVLKRTRQQVRGSSASDRLRFLAGDAFTVDFGGPYDLILLSHVLHHFNVAKCRTLLGRLRSALKPGGRLAVREFVVDDSRTRRSSQLLFALTMLLWTQEGDAYSFSELREMLTRSGFRAIRFFGRNEPAQTLLART